MGEVTESVEKAVAAGLLPAGGAVLSACSGGADSVALTVALTRCSRVQVAVGHVDHGLRPESAQEAKAVRALADRLGVRFFVERLSGLPVREAGLEAAAREGRYAALARLAAQAGCSVVATAHTRRDQAETLLLRLLRGAGPGALAGVRRSRQLAPGVMLLRPLLDVSRQATEAYCREQGVPFLTDPHNSDPARARARLRALWPRLLELNPRLEEALAGAAELAASEDELLEELAARADLPAAHPALQRRMLLAEAARAGLRPERGHIEELRKLLGKQAGGVDLPGGRGAWDPAEKKIFFSRAGADDSKSVVVPGPGRYPWRSRELSVALGSGGGVAVDLARAPFPWTLRNCRPGDRFGRRKIADQWTHIPRDRRPGLALLQDAQARIFWVEGLREGEASTAAADAAASFRIR